jgi:formate transporter
MVLLGVWVGAFIGLGSMAFALVTSDASLSFAASRLLGGLVFSLGLLLVMAWADGRIRAGEVLRNGVVVCLANLGGAAAKCSMPADEAFYKGVLCKLLVGMAVWISMAARSVADKAVAVVPPVCVFVAAGFVHNLAFVIPGNLVGGSVLVGLVYHLIYRKAR